MTDTESTYELEGCGQWAVLYASAYGRLCAIVNSYQDGLITKDEMNKLYESHINDVYHEVSHLAEKAAKFFLHSRERREAADI